MIATTLISLKTLLCLGGATKAQLAAEATVARLLADRVLVPLRADGVQQVEMADNR